MHNTNGRHITAMLYIYVDVSVIGRVSDLGNGSVEGSASYPIGSSSWQTSIGTLDKTGRQHGALRWPAAIGSFIKINGTRLSSLRAPPGLSAFTYLSWAFPLFRPLRSIGVPLSFSLRGILARNATKNKYIERKIQARSITSTGKNKRKKKDNDLFVRPTLTMAERPEYL